MRSLAQQGGRYQVPTQGLAHQIGCHLPHAQGAVPKVPQRALSFLGLVDGQGCQFLVADGHKQRCVGTPGDQTLYLDFTVREKVQDAFMGEGDGRVLPGLHVRWPFLRGQKWPSGSIGSPHMAQVGRPAATISWPRMLKARIWASVAQNRATDGDLSSSSSINS